MAADKVCSFRADRLYLRRRGVRAVLPERKDRAANREKRGSREGRPIRHDVAPYKERDTAGRCVNRTKEWRGPASRFDKTPESHLTGPSVRGAIPWIRSLDPA